MRREMNHPHSTLVTLAQAELLALTRSILEQSFGDKSSPQSAPGGAGGADTHDFPGIQGELQNSRLSPETQEILSLPFGVFVTLKEGKNLRGCIGQFATEKPLGTILAQVTQDAGFRDPRFSPLQRQELERISISLSLLSPDEPINGWNDIQLGVHGIILFAQGRRSVFLPEVPVEQGWDLETTLSALARKAGLAHDAWKEPESRFRVFTTYHVSEMDVSKHE